MLNTGHYLTFVAFITLFFCGAVQYLTGIGAVLWLPFLLTMAMLLLLSMQTAYDKRPLDKLEWVVLALFIGFIGLALASTVLQSGIKVTIIGFKNELGVALILFCMILGFVSESQLYRTTKILYYIFYAQFPLLLYQILIVVPHRVAIKGEFEKWDSVVGSFGGDPMGGGNSAVMGMFCLLIMLMKLSEFKHGLTTKRSLVGHIAAAFFACVVGEIKFVILLTPLLLTYVLMSGSYVKGVKGANLKTVLLILIGSSVLITIAVYLLGMSYSTAFGADPGKSPFLIFWDSIAYIFDPNYIMEGGQLGRMTTLFFWSANSELYGFGGELFGYGLNATNHGSTVAPGFLNLIFNVELDSTSLSVMLWELGSAGTALFLLMVFFTLLITGPKPVFERGDLSDEDIRLLSLQPAIRAFILGCLLSLPYSQILMMVSMLQFLFYFALGASLVIRSAVLKYTDN